MGKILGGENLNLALPRSRLNSFPLLAAIEQQEISARDTLFGTYLIKNIIFLKNNLAKGSERDCPILMWSGPSI